MKDNKKVILLVLDGVGINKAYSGNAVTLANMAYI
jgi:bisphosphoglycerate-independent phosphoglycerate mutase (AlkP superfamily)